MAGQRQSVHANSTRRPGIDAGGSDGFGGTFIDNAAFRTRVFETFGARLLDMESSAVARVDCTNHVLLVAARGLADLAGAGAGAIQMVTSLELVEGNGAAAVRAMLREFRIAAERAARRERAMPMPSESTDRFEFPQGCERRKTRASPAPFAAELRSITASGGLDMQFSRFP
ncbi:MAG: hypothetical protein OXH79_02725 [Boseongicola sp.]|nr:hypothetical protein [Boseongicola sp.]